MALVRDTQLVVVDVRPTVHQPKLVEREPGMHLDRERARDDLEVQPPAVAGRDLIEAMAVIGQQAGEHVDTTGRALRIGLAADLRRQVELFDERDEVRPVALEHRAVASEVDLAHDEVLESLFDRVVVARKERAPQPIGDVAEMQIDARRLDRRLGNEGSDPSG